MKLFVERHFLFLAALVALLAAFNLFYQLGESELENWDESRYGITAYDMLRSGDFIRTTVLGQPDYWNLKPPLGYWAICASYKIFGVNRLGLRFPAALSALLSVILLMGLARKYFSPGTALLAGLILATNLHFITRHAGRSGDLDAMLTLLYLVFVWILASYAKTQRVHFILIGALTASLVFLLKSFAVALPLLLAFAFILFKDHRSKIGYRELAMALLVFLTPISLWALLRYQVDGTAFLWEMVRYDLLKASHKTIEGHAGHALAYFKFIGAYFFPWCLFLLAIPFYRNFAAYKKGNGGPLLYLCLNEFYRNPIWWLAILVPFLIISIVIETKTEWYVVPIYPFLALWIAWHLDDFLSRPRHRILGVVAPALLVLVPAASAEISIAKAISRPNDNSKQVFLRSIPPELKSEFHVVEKIGDDWKQSSLFFLYAKKGLIPDKAASVADFLNRPDDHLLLLEKKQFEACGEKSSLVTIFASSEWMLLAKRTSRSESLHSVVDRRI